MADLGRADAVALIYERAACSVCSIYIIHQREHRVTL